MTKTPVDHNFTEVAYLQLVNEYAHTWIDMCIYWYSIKNSSKLQHAKLHDKVLNSITKTY